MIPPPSGTIQSIRQRLLNRARERGEDFHLTLVRYGVERFPYRLSLSDCAGEYVVKGATLFEVWLDQPHRPTRDLDVNRYKAVTRAQLESHVRDICAEEFLDDGLAFDLSGPTIDPIRRAQEGQGRASRGRIRPSKASAAFRLSESS